MRFFTFRTVGLFAIPATIVAGIACSASSGNTEPSGLPISGAGGDATNPFPQGGQGGVTNPGGGNAGQQSFGGLGFGGFGTTPPPDAGACTKNTFGGERLPLDIYFLVDKSGSMDQDNKWQSVSDALIAFLNDPNNGEIGVGIGWFPLVLPGINPFCTVDADCQTYGPCVGGIDIGGGSHLFGNCQGADVCQVSAYAAPAVPLALPPNHAPVVSAIQAMSPGGGTPTRPALEGAMQYTVSWAQANPGRKTILVLASDGEPTGCQQNAVQDSANIAANGLSQNGIQTFVIGVGQSLTSLNQIAQAGGSGQAYIVDAGGNTQQQFAEALAKIHGAALPCDFHIPADGTADPNNVNITFTSNTNMTPQYVPRSADGTVGTCPNDGTPAWYYDNPGAPSQVVLCDSTCTNLKTISARVDFVLGCPTQVAPPPH
jgi:hypothetical protein